MKADEIQAKNFLMVLRAGALKGFLEFRCIRNSGDVVRRFYPDPASIDWSELSGLNADGYGIYFGVCPRGRQSGKKEDVCSVHAFWVDLDSKDFEGGKPEIHAKIQRELPSSLRPSIVVDSGHGLHAYWLLTTPILIDGPGAFDFCESRMRGLGELLNGDYTHDLGRILRLPGTINWKFPEAPVRCEIIESCPTRRFEASQFDSFCVEESLGPPERVDSEHRLLDVELAGLRVSKRIKELIERGREADPTRYPSNSEADFAVILGLLSCGHSDDEIFSVFSNEAWAIGRKFKQQGLGYLDHSIGRARAKLRGASDERRYRAARAKGRDGAGSGSGRSISSRNWKQTR